MEHTCHARGCNTTVPPRMFMCGRHWRMIPRSLQRLLWQAYRPGQEVDKEPSRTYMQVAKICINHVARDEHPDCRHCSNDASCCMEHRLHVDEGRAHTNCILR